MSISRPTYRELYPGVSLKEVRIFIIEKCREYYSEGFRLPRDLIIVDDCHQHFFNGNEPEGAVFSPTIFKMKYHEVREHYRKEIMEKQLSILF